MLKCNATKSISENFLSEKRKIMNDNKKKDIRTIATKQILKDTVLSLIQKKSVLRITVKEICENAFVNRGTFYRYYPDLYGILEEMLDDFLHCTGSTEKYTCLLQTEEYDCPYGICDKLYQNTKYGALLFDEKISDIVIRKIADYSKDKYVNSLLNSCKLTSEQAEKIFYFQLNGCLAVNKQVFMNDGKGWKDTRNLIGEFIQSGLRHFMK